MTPIREACRFDPGGEVCLVHGGGWVCLVRMGQALQDVREQARAEAEEGCRHKDALMWWKAEALLAAAGRGTELERLMIAAVVLIPVPPDVARERMEEAKRALMGWENTRAGRTALTEDLRMRVERAFE